MEVRLSPDQQELVRQAIETGRFRCEEDAIHEALRVWEAREREREKFLTTLDDAARALARDEGRVITRESMTALADEVKERGLARLANESKDPH